MTEQPATTPIIHTAPLEIISLVDRFSGQISAYKAGKYNETQLRRDFLDPLFDALGWDMTNRKNLPENLREVIDEVSVEVEGHAKAADYSFQFGGKTHFFLEAKKPSVNIETNPYPAFQIRRYAWSAKVPISIVSDFEQLAVYDCRVKPVYGDPAHLGRIELFSFTDYVDKWDKLYRLFSYQSVHEGSLDKYVVSLKGKRGTADVDDVFLVEMERWREELAHNLALRNPSLTQHELNSAVQTTIDRIIFLRICEERGIEAEDALRDATDGKQVYEDLLVLFKQADKKYNSGLFHFSAEKGQSSYPDNLTPYLKIDDKILKEILANLYYPKSPYAFNYFSADILGQVYERFLGKVITLTPAHRAHVDYKPEVRKAGGVYYTPTYIVDYIVKNTVGELLKEADPETLNTDPLRVLDPACGSGSFLIGAYQYLLDWYLDWYVQHDPSRWSRGKTPPIYEVRTGWQLTMEKKKDILTSHIFGVDIDAQAVEVTKLSLLLKVVENPGQPDLGANIKCGNSLIGPDFYDDQQQGLFDTEEQHRVNAFDWHTAFPEIFKNGGFDTVIGNPPYFSAVTLDSPIQKYFSKKYRDLWASRNDISYYFLLDAIRICKRCASFIMPRYYLNSFYAEKLRGFLLTKGQIEIVDTGNYQCFQGVNILTTIIKVNVGNEDGICYYFADNKNDELNILSSLYFPKEQISSSNWNFNKNNFLLEKIVKNNGKLGDYFLIAKGMSTGLNEAFEIKDDQILNINDRRYLHPLIKNGDIRRYTVLDKGERFVIYLENQESIDNLPEYKQHLSLYISQLKSRNSATGKWFHYSTTRNKELWERNVTKIVVPFMATENRFAIEERSVISTSGDVSALIPIFGENRYEIKYFVGILNSKFLNFFHRNTTKLKRGGYMEYVTKQLINIPIRNINFSDSADVARHARLVNLVETMLSLHKKTASARLPEEKERLQRQIQTTDRQIDKLVYELYNLTPAEIAIVEGS
jgi:type I restriction-modification system DNA methylase subunit